jgi:hypothetical protein
LTYDGLTGHQNGVDHQRRRSFTGTIGHAFTDKQANRALNLKQKLLLFLREVISPVKNRIALTGALVDPLQSRLFLDTIMLELKPAESCRLYSTPSLSTLP